MTNIEMMTDRHLAVTHDTNDAVIAEFRANAGSVTHAMGGALAGLEVALLHHVGRISGQAYVTPVWYVAHDNDFLVLGYPTGAAAEPQWVENLEQATAVTVEFADGSRTMTPEVLHSGPERDRLYEIVIAQWPFEADQQHMSRPLPVVRLTPRD